MKHFIHHLRNQIITAIGSGLAIAMVSLISFKISIWSGSSVWLIAPIGASVALVFAAPYSPFSQPKNVIIGNCLSALCGIFATVLVNDKHIAASVAVGLAIGMMMIFRVLHPPGGGVALLMVLTQSTSPMIVIFPTTANSIILVICGILFHKLTGQHYPHLHLINPSQTKSD